MLPEVRKTRSRPLLLAISALAVFLAAMLANGASTFAAGSASRTQMTATVQASNASLPSTLPGPGQQCGPANDGQVITLPSGTKLICTYYQGVWQWIVKIPGCAQPQVQYARTDGTVRLSC